MSTESTFSENPQSTLKIVKPDFDSKLTELIIELDHLRTQNRWEGTMPEPLFQQFQTVLFMVESVATARIEGNHTTILEFVNSKIDDFQPKAYGILELNNLEKALQFIEQNRNYPINRMFISHLHTIIMDSLPIEHEGDYTPGEYRRENVAIGNAVHQPPESIQVNDYMTQLFDFIAKPVAQRYELLKIAIAHHRFVWIHPFTNGNGRTARLLTYAMLVRAGFAVEAGRIVNPAAVFCSTREQYYQYLSKADESVASGNDDGMLQWCQYVLSGLKKETDNMSHLTDYNFVKTKLLLPTLKHAKENEIITPTEFQLLEKALGKQPFQASDVKDVFSHRASKSTAVTISRILKSLRDKKMIVPSKENGRSYYIQIVNNPLLRGLIKAMDVAMLLPIDPNT